MKRPIGAVTFDLWDCVFVDDSDEAKRAAAGVPPKPVARRELVHGYIERHGPIARDRVDLAYDVTDAAFGKVWHDQHVTWTVRERLQVMLSGLGRELPEEEMAELVRLHEEMELAFRPDVAQGAVAALKALRGRYPLVVVSDAIFSPGRCLRELLAGEGVLDCFDHFVFSDEIGRSKPDRAMFDAAAKAAGCAASDLVHVGDRPHNDIGGPHAVGARGVLLTVVKDRGSEASGADAVCDDYGELGNVLAAMDAA